MPTTFSCLQRSKKPTSSTTIVTTIQGLRTGHDSGGDGSEAYPLDAALPRFGPIYKEDNGAMQEAKRSALRHILNDDEALRDDYIRSIAKIQQDIIRSYNLDGLRPGSEFQEKIVNDGCFFLLVALYILGGGEHLRFPDEHPYFGENRDLADWIPALFFVGNQIPYIVIRALMQQDFFRSVIRRGTWGQPPQDPLKLVLYRTNLVICKRLVLSVIHRGIYLRRSNKGINNIRFRNLVICACLYVPPLLIDRNTKHMIRCVTSHEQNLPESDREVTAYFQLMRNLAATYKDFKILEKVGSLK